MKTALSCSDFCEEVSLIYLLISLVLDGVCRRLCATRCFLVCDTDLKCPAVFHSNGLIVFGLVELFFFFVFFNLRNDTCIPHPLSFLCAVLFLCIRFCTNHHLLHHGSCTVRLDVGKQSDLCVVCVSHLIDFLLFFLVGRTAHLDESFTLTLLFLLTFLCFSVSFHMDWHFLLHPLSFLCCSLSPPPFSVWCVLNWEGIQPFFFSVFDWSICCIWCLLIG